MSNLPELDLVECPFTDAESRLLVVRGGDGLAITSAEYQRTADQSRVLPRLSVLRMPGGQPCGVQRADAAVVDLIGGGSIVFADTATLSLGLPPGDWRLELHTVAASEVRSTTGSAVTEVAGRSLSWRVDAKTVEQSVDPAGEVVRIDVGDPAGTRIVVTTAGLDRAVSPHADLIAGARDRWAAWFDRLPSLRSDLVDAGRLAWWVLRANQLRLAHDPSRPMVVPSKLGYVGAWQWDSYFVAAGLRHGAPEQAWDQVEMFLDHQLENGLIPDVVSDDGVLASIEGLPPDDPRFHVELQTGQTEQPAGPMPVTKPPLTAWALAQVNRLDPDPDRLARARSRIVAAQQWWTSDSDTDGDGLSEYLHPYSSGLDDSPLFDAGMPAEPPDLNSYLAVQDDALAEMAESAGDDEAAARHRDAAQGRVQRMLETRWDAAEGRFVAYAAGRPLPIFTPFSLMPLLTGRLPAQVVETMVQTMRARLWGDRPLPTVAYDEPTFDADRMWRGPVWVNVNRLVAEGLVASGHRDEARELAERTLAMVCESGGMYEYWNPLTGTRPPSAVPSFAWSAALFIDLAVAVTNDLDLLRVSRS